MHRSYAPFVLTLALAVSASTAQAQTQTPPVALTLREALQRGAEDPPAVRVALARADAARAQIDLARAGYYPTVTATGSGSLGFSDGPSLQVTVNPMTLARQVEVVRFQAENAVASAGVTARIPIYDFGRTSNSSDAATHGSNAAREDLRAARVQAMSTVAAAYLTVLSDQEALNTARATVAQREAHLRIAEGLVEAGARPPIERLRAQVDLDVGRLDLTSAEARERLDRSTLAAALGIDPLRDVTIAAVDEDFLRVDDDPARASTASVANRPEFAAARMRVLQAESQAAGARSGRYPIFSAQATGSASYNGVINGQSPSGVSEQLQGGVTLTWPIFDPTVGANVHMNDANVVGAREALAQQSLQVRSAAVQAAISVRAARVTLDQSDRLVASSAANLDQATGRYQSGAAALLELVDAQAADANARFAVVRARLAFHIARVNLLTATGEIERLAR